MRWICVLMLLSGCDLFFGDDGGSDDGVTDDGSDGTAGGWAVGSHPCDSRTDAVWFDSSDVGFLGCGNATSGEGLFTTTDGGITWTDVVTDPVAWFDAFRVNDLFRGADGVLYAAGGGGGLGVVSIADDGTLGDVWAPGATIGRSFTVGQFRVASDGYAVVSSNTGVDTMSRIDGSVGPDDWIEEGGNWATDGGSHGMLSLDVYNDEFYACGSRIIEPPKVFLPAAAPTGTGLELDVVELSSGAFGWEGELWAIDVDEGGIVAGGLDEDLHFGHVFTIDHASDASNPDNWSDFNLADVYPDDSTTIRGVCRNDDHVVAAGSFSVRADGIVFESMDGGATWTEITPDEPPPMLWNCWVHKDGGIVVTGAGYSAVLD